MISNSLKTIILAAGESKRILSSKSKILHTIGGKTILGHVLDNIGKIISKKNTNIVISPKLQQLRNEYKNGLNEVWGNLRLFEDKGKKGKK